MEDKYKILPPGVNIPYVAVEITEEFFKEVEHLNNIVFYTTNGQKIFDVRDKDGKDTGKKMIFLLFLKEPK